MEAMPTISNYPVTVPLQEEQPRGNVSSTDQGDGVTAGLETSTVPQNAGQNPSVIHTRTPSAEDSSMYSPENRQRNGESVPEDSNDDFTTVRSNNISNSTSRVFN